MDEQQKPFIKNEIWTLTFGAGFQRANVYLNPVKEIDKKNFKKRLKEFIETDILPFYESNLQITDEQHLSNINKISTFSNHFENILQNGKLNFGVSQKLLNLLLKYLWCLFEYPEPPHFPLDYRIQESLNKLAKKSGISRIKFCSWTKMTDSKDYMEIIEYIRKHILKENQTLAQFELVYFERRRNQP